MSATGCELCRHPGVQHGPGCLYRKLCAPVASDLSFTLVFSSTLLSDIKAALCSRVAPNFTEYGACVGVPLTSPGGLATLAQRHECVGVLDRAIRAKVE